MNQSDPELVPWQPQRSRVFSGRQVHVALRRTQRTQFQVLHQRPGHVQPQCCCFFSFFFFKWLTCACSVHVLLMRNRFLVMRPHDGIRPLSHSHIFIFPSRSHLSDAACSQHMLGLNRSTHRQNNGDISPSLDSWCLPGRPPHSLSPTG